MHRLRRLLEVGQSCLSNHTLIVRHQTSPVLGKGDRWADHHQGTPDRLSTMLIVAPLPFVPSPMERLSQSGPAMRCTIKHRIAGPEYPVYVVLSVVTYGSPTTDMSQPAKCGLCAPPVTTRFCFHVKARQLHAHKSTGQKCFLGSKRCVIKGDAGQGFPRGSNLAAIQIYNHKLYYIIISYNIFVILLL